MGIVRYATRAEDDLDQIAEYTKSRWDAIQTARYLDEIETGCERLADNPKLGRLYGHRRFGVRRIEQGSHVIFYEPSADGILVIRILHKSMVPGLHSL